MPTYTGTETESATPSASVTSGVSSPSKIAWPQAGEIVNQAAVEVGLSPASDPYTSTDANFVQLRYLLNSLGKQLVHYYHWTHLRRDYSFTTVTGKSVYELPPDYHNMLDQTMWNRTTRLPIGGPLSPQEWEYLSARVAGVVFNVLFRPADRVMQLYPPTAIPDALTISYQYVSKNWVSVDSAPAFNTLESASNSTDYLWFDHLLLVRGLKLQFMQAKGFDTTYLVQEYERTLEMVRSHDTPAAIISLNRGAIQRMDVPIGVQSVPITGFGT